MKRNDRIDVAQLVADARDLLTVKRVFGDPIDHNGIQVIPVAKVRGGGGGGGGSTPDSASGEVASEGGGGGFGMMATPAGAFVIKGDDVKWHPATNPARLALAAFAFASLVALTIRSIAVARLTARR
ncbi:MAG: sporulation protein [Actinobacteria bacterium]|nr:sporulation protein [Actinomycetota bacterium]